MLKPAQKQRYARHLLLPEIGADGQARLCAASVRFPGSADVRASDVARVYLERAGIDVRPADAENATLARAVPATREVQAIAGAPDLVEAAAALCGALAAVEVIKAELGIGRAAGLPAVVLSGEPSP
ncbi:MAG: hypothetical protein ACHQ53_10820 [Polyangiales bacterium]